MYKLNRVLLHQTLITNLIIFALNFCISVLYAQNLSIENRGILVASILYPQLAIGLFSFGLLRSLPAFLGIHRVRKITKLQLILSISFCICSALFLKLMVMYFDKPIFLVTYLYPILSAASTILMLSILARSNELTYNILRTMYHLLLLITISSMHDVERIIQAIVMCNAIIAIIALSFLKFKTEVSVDNSKIDVTKGLIFWSLLTTINNNALILAIDSISGPSAVAITAITLSYFRLQNLYVSSVAILSFFQRGQKKIDLKIKFKFVFIFNLILFAFASILIPKFYGDEYYRLETATLCAVLLFFTSINELVAQEFYKKGHITPEIVAKLLIVVGLIILYIVDVKLDLILTTSFIILLFIVFEIVRSIILKINGPRYA